MQCYTFCRKSKFVFHNVTLTERRFKVVNTGFDSPPVFFVLTFNLRSFQFVKFETNNFMVVWKKTHVIINLLSFIFEDFLIKLSFKLVLIFVIISSYIIQYDPLRANLF